LTSRKVGRQQVRQAERLTDRKVGRQQVRQTERLTGSKSGRQKVWQTASQTGRQIVVEMGCSSVEKISISGFGDRENGHDH
jgi:hypothetical protein